MLFTTTVLSLLVAAVGAAPTSLSPAANSIVQNKWIITLKPGVSPEQFITSRGLKRRFGAGVEKVYDMAGFTGYSGEFDSTTIEEIKNDENVAAVELDTVVELYQTGPLTTQTDAPWGLGSISHRTPNHTEYLYDARGGAGTWAYIIDTGLYVEHKEFGANKGELGYNAYPNTNFTDKVGHGTHVAGTIASASYGVAKEAKVISVRVFDTGSSTNSIVLDGYQWAVNDILAKGRATKAVISMSLGGGRSDAMNAAVKAAYNSGITTVVAAGNQNANASLYSPASAPEAITVGASDISNTRAYFSNYGTLVDVFAPGVDVLSTWIGASDATNIISGTSMATPHVSGLVLYFMSLGMVATPAEAAEMVVGLATKGVVSDVRGSPNLLAFNGAGVEETV